MGLFSLRSLLILAAGVLLAMFMGYPRPSMSTALKSWKQAGYYYSHNGEPIFYRDDEGHIPEAPTVVCLHGFPSFSYDWLKVWPDLKQKFGRVIAIDFIGFGFSAKSPDQDYTIKEQADIVEAMLKHLSVGEVHVLAHDYGDTVAQELLARFEDRKRAGQPDGPVLLSVCLLNGGIFPETHFPRIIQKALLIPYFGPIISRMTNYFLLRRSFGEVFGPDTWPTEQEFGDFWYGIRYNDGHTINYKLIDYIPQRLANRDRWVGALQQATIPVHVVYGPADPVNPPKFVDHYKSLVPNSDVTVLDVKIGHYPQWEAPQATMQAYFSFLRKSVMKS